MAAHEAALFVCGTPVSGTTALATLLNTSPNIVLGVVRYGRLLTLYGRGRQHSAGDRIRDLFRKDGILGDRLPDGTKPFPFAERAAALPKWDYATYVGDRVPNLYKCTSTCRRSRKRARKRGSSTWSATRTPSPRARPEGRFLRPCGCDRTNA